MREVMRPTVDGMAKDGSPYVGFLYAGLMIDADGTPKVLEFNCRFGDPETQPILFRLQSDLVDHIEAALRRRTRPANHRLESAYLSRRRHGGRWLSHVVSARANALTACRTSRPPRPRSFMPAHPTGTAMLSPQVDACCASSHSATRHFEAQQAAYQLVREINWPDAYYRTDIGYRAVARERTGN